MRNVSPKVIFKDKMDYPNLHNNNQPQPIQKIPISFLNKNVPKQPLFNKPKPNLTKEANSFQSNSSNKILNPIPSKNNILTFNKEAKYKKMQQIQAINMFDDYYQNKKMINPKLVNKQDASLSNDSCQSQGIKTVKKNMLSPKSLADKGDLKSPKHFLPFKNDQEKRESCKFPLAREQKKNHSDVQRQVKKPLNFREIAKKQYLQHDEKETSNNNSKGRNIKLFISNPKPIVLNAKMPVESSDKKIRPQIQKLNINNQMKMKEKSNMGTFMINSKMKSSPYLAKYAVDSSAEMSEQKGIKKEVKPARAKVEPLLKQLKDENINGNVNKRSKKQQNNSFNKGELFLDLMKRQQMHSKLIKEINILGIHINLIGLTSEGEKSISFVLVRKIYQSQSTVIFLGYEEKTNFLYCLKRTPMKFDKHIKEFIRQHKTHLFCNHPHITRSFCTAYDSQHLYLIMEYMQGQTLRQQMKNIILKNMSEQSAAKTRINQSATNQITKINKIRKILYEILGAVAFLHDKNIIHKDIKPDNIFVSHDSYKIGDFGTASHVDFSQYVGTLDYAAPEILSQAEYDQKVDVWSLGCIAFELDVGRPPFFSITTEQTKSMIINSPYNSDLICDHELKRLIAKMLEKNKNLRISAKLLLKSDFFSSLKEGQGLV